MHLTSFIRKARLSVATLSRLGYQFSPSEQLFSFDFESDIINALSIYNLLHDPCWELYTEFELRWFSREFLRPKFRGILGGSFAFRAFARKGFLGHSYSI